MTEAEPGIPFDGSAETMRRMRDPFAVEPTTDEAGAAAPKQRASIPPDAG